MKVLYASFDVVPAPKGAAVHIEAFVRALARRHELTLLTLAGGGDARLDIPRLTHLTAQVAEPNLLRRALQFGDAVEEHLDTHEYDVVHVRSPWEGVRACLAKRYKKHAVCYELNGLPSIELPCHYPAVGQRKRLLHKLRRDELLCMKLADVIVTPSTVTADYIAQQQITADKVTVIPNGVDTELFHPGSGNSGDLRELLYVGTLAPWQGLELLMRAMRKLLGRTGAPLDEADEEANQIEPVDVRLTVCGGGKKRWRKETQRRARKLHVDDRTEFTGPLPQAEIAERIRAAGICVAPLAPDERNTVQGCCPIKLLEYAACGRPIVCADLRVATDLLTPERELAVYRPKSAHHLAQRIAELVQRPALAAELGRNAAERVRREYTWTRAGRHLLGVYENLGGNAG